MAIINAADPALDKEIAAARRHLTRLCEQAGMNAPFSEDPPRLKVPLTPEEMAELINYSRRFQTSPASLGHLALRNLLNQLRQGARPMVPRSTLKDAIEVTCLGEEV